MKEKWRQAISRLADSSFQEFRLHLAVSRRSKLTFDIDANGIVNVSAKDLGTGKEQRITITSSTKLSDDEIKQKIKEAEQFADEDKKRKEEVEVRNRAETLVYETEKSLKDIEASLSEDEKSKINNSKDALSRALEGNDIQDIKAKTDGLTEEFHTISAKDVSASTAGHRAEPADFDPNMGNMGGAAAEEDSQPKPDNVVDADYEVVDEDKKITSP